MITRALASAVFCLLLSGCALTEDKISINHQPQASAEPLKLTPTIPVEIKAIDERKADQTKVSNKINGYGMDMAAIRSDRDVSAIFVDAIQSELTAIGYKIGSFGAKVQVSIYRFYNQFKTGFWSGRAVSEVSLDVKVISPSGAETYRRRVDVEGGKTGVGLANGSNAKASLEDGLNKALAELMGDKAFHIALGARPAGATETPTN